MAAHIGSFYFCAHARLLFRPGPLPRIKAVAVSGFEGIRAPVCPSPLLQTSNPNPFPPPDPQARFQHLPIARYGPGTHDTRRAGRAVYRSPPTSHTLHAKPS
ncbi:hypothetical protein BDY21DRAFT_354238, partial [Lineolata rhizophorae]